MRDAGRVSADACHECWPNPGSRRPHARHHCTSRPPCRLLAAPLSWCAARPTRPLLRRSRRRRWPAPGSTRRPPPPCLPWTRTAGAPTTSRCSWCGAAVVGLPGGVRRCPSRVRQSPARSVTLSADLSRPLCSTSAPRASALRTRPPSWPRRPHRCRPSAPPTRAPRPSTPRTRPQRRPRWRQRKRAASAAEAARRAQAAEVAATQQLQAVEAAAREAQRNAWLNSQQPKESYHAQFGTSHR